MHRRPWFRRAGAALGMLALLAQCLVFAFHHPAQAAVASPFHDPAAWCGTADRDRVPPSGQDAPKVPLHHGLVCPICQSLQAAGPGLLPVLVLLIEPTSVRRAAPASVETASPALFGRPAANPRAPPISL